MISWELMGFRLCVLLLAASCLPACGISVDYDGTEYRCNESGRCPDGYRCDDGLCVDDSDPDGDERPDAATSSRPDAREEITMVSASSQPELTIPDDVEQGVLDAIGFQVTDCTIEAITVDVVIEHDFPGDLVIQLSSPSDTEVDLRDFGINDGGDDVIGTYPTTLEPSESLDAFLGEDARGLWMLRVADLDDGDNGILHAWGVNLWCD